MIIQASHQANEHPVARRSLATLPPRQIAPMSVSVWAAPDAIIQILTNLLSNAIKFSQPGGKIWLSAELELKKPQLLGKDVLRPCPFIRFATKDHGRGIPSDKLETVFERFQQVDASDSRDKGGTGLGLAICRKLIEQHGGRIWVESVLGEGSTFYFTLPMVEEDMGNNNPKSNHLPQA